MSRRYIAIYGIIFRYNNMIRINTGIPIKVHLRKSGSNIPLCSLMHYGTYNTDKIKQLEKDKRSFLKGFSLDVISKHELTEYLIISNQFYKSNNLPDNLLESPLNNNAYKGLLEFAVKIRNGAPVTDNYRSLGNFHPVSPECSWKFANNIPSMLKGGKNILDIGAGTFYPAIEYAKQHPEHFIIGVEPNAMMVTLAYENLSRIGLLKKPLNNLKIVLGDMAIMPPPPNFKADLAIARGVFHFVSPEQSIKITEGVLNWLSPSGDLFVSPGHKEEINNHIIICMKGSKAHTGIPIFDPPK
jgi:SAM-dependent methyltransferase